MRNGVVKIKWLKRKTNAYESGEKCKRKYLYSF